MTVSSDLNRISYSGNGSTTVFPVNYYFLEDTHLQVILITAAGVETIQTLTTNYTVSGAGNPAGGSVTMLVAPPTGTTIVIQRDVPATQETDYLANDPFPAESHERALDKLTMLAQQNERENGRALKIPLSAVPTTSTELPLPVGNKLLAWNSNASAVINLDPSDVITVTGQQNSYGDVFTGNGVTTDFTLTRNPGSVFNIDVSINGVTQVPNVDYILNATTLTFTSAPPAVASQILARYSEVFTLNDADSANVRYVPTDPLYPFNTVEEVLRQFDFLGSSTTGVWYRAGTNYESQGAVVKVENRPFYHDYRPTVADGSPFNADGGNMFFGFGSGNFTMKPDNTAIGDYNLHTSHNIGFGIQALGQLTTGYKNVGIGTNAFRKLTQGFGNVAVGRDAGHEQTTGISNTFVGFTAGFDVVTGSNNVALGTSALYNNQAGASNTAVGRRAGFDPTSGNNCTFVGAQSGFGHLSGSFNTFIGSQTANNGLTTAQNCTIVGARVTGLEDEDGQVVLADGNGVKYFITNPSGTSAAFAYVAGRDATAVDLSATDGQIDAGSSLIAQNTASSNNSFAQVAFQSRASQTFGRIVYWDGTAPKMSFLVNGVEPLRFNQNGDSFIKVNSVAPVPPANQVMTFQLVSDTELKILVKGSDGTTRSVSLTLS